LGLQAALLGHGGVTTLGVNTSTFGVSAMVAWGLHHQLARRLGLPPFLCGAIAAAAAVLASGVLLMLLLLSAGEGFRRVAQYALLAHLPVLVIEAIVTGFTVEFLHRVQPVLLRGGVP
jgi:cobalt/nickel transport system permease protein